MKHIWIRKEYKPYERRVALIPAHARILIENGLNVTVENYDDRVFSIDEYEKVGCKIVPGDAWIDAPSDAYILGLKELPDGHGPIFGKHIFFAHAFKGQPSSAKLLNRFQQSKGSIYDLEYIKDISGKRMVVFGFYAGICAVAVSLEIWYKAMENANYSKLTKNYYDSYSELLEATKSFAVLNPRVLIIGVTGRCAQGAISLLEKLQLQHIGLNRTDIKNQRLVQSNIARADIIINCVSGSQDNLEPIVTLERLKNNADNTTIIDLTCEPFSPYNPVPIYKKVTTFSHPVQTTTLNDKKFHLCAIDHIPSYLPRESSFCFSEKLMPLILHGEQSVCWINSASAFKVAKLNQLKQEIAGT